MSLWPFQASPQGCKLRLLGEASLSLPALESDGQDCNPAFAPQVLSHEGRSLHFSIGKVRVIIPASLGYCGD